MESLGRFSIADFVRPQFASWAHSDGPLESAATGEFLGLGGLTLIYGP